MAENIPNQTAQDQDAVNCRKDLPMVTGIFLSLLALSYVVASVHARSISHGVVPSSVRTLCYPLELFAIAILPATFGVIFLHWEKLPLSETASRRLRSLVLFAAGLAMAAWFALVVP